MMEKSMPVFVKLEEYKEVLDIIEIIRSKLSETKDNINKISQLKTEEDAEIAAWKDNVMSVERKLQLIDEILLEPRF